MTLTVGQVIEGARDEHPTFTRENHPDPLVLRHLDRWQRNIIGKAIAEDSSVLMETLDTDFPLSDFDAGVDLPDYKALHPGGTVYEGGNDEVQFELEILNHADRFDRRRHYAAWVEAGTLHFVEDARWWNAVSRVVVKYVAEPAALTALDSPLVLPDSVEEAAIARAARFMAKRSKAEDGVDSREFAAAALGAEDDFLDELTRRGRATVGQIVNAW